MQEEQEAKAEEEQFPDPAAQERKRSEEAEKWRLHQLQAGASSEDNANFQVGFRLCVLIRPHVTQQLYLGAHGLRCFQNAEMPDTSPRCVVEFRVTL